MALKTRQPTGKIPWPFILLAGEDKAGKSYTAATFCASKKVGRRFWLDLNEGAADEYVSLSLRGPDDSGYEIIDHNGTFADILDQIIEVDKIAREADAKGEPPVVLVVDSISALWKMLSIWATSRASRTKANQSRLAADPDAEIDITVNFWNDSNARHRRIVDALMGMPAIVIATARLAEKVVMSPTGRPTNDKVWKAETQKDLPYDATALIYLHREGRVFSLAGVRSIHVPQPDGHPTMLAEGSLDLERFIWDGLRCSQEASGGRVMAPLVADPAEKYLVEISTETDAEALRVLWRMATDELPPSDDRDRVHAAITRRVEVLAEQQQEKPDPTADVKPEQGRRLRAAAKVPEPSLPPPPADEPPPADDEPPFPNEPPADDDDTAARIRAAFEAQNGSPRAHQVTR